MDPNLILNIQKSLSGECISSIFISNESDWYDPEVMMNLWLWYIITETNTNGAYDDLKDNIVFDIIKDNKIKYDNIFKGLFKKILEEKSKSKDKSLVLMASSTHVNIDNFAVVYNGSKFSVITLKNNELSTENIKNITKSNETNQLTLSESGDLSVKSENNNNNNESFVHLILAKEK